MSARPRKDGGAEKRALDADERIRELVEAAPEFSTDQINRIRLLLHAAPEVSGTAGGDVEQTT